MAMRPERLRLPARSRKASLSSSSSPQIRQTSLSDLIGAMLPSSWPSRLHWIELVLCTLGARHAGHAGPGPGAVALKLGHREQPWDSGLMCRRAWFVECAGRAFSPKSDVFVDRVPCRATVP